jgi:YfiH family protein
MTNSGHATSGDDSLLMIRRGRIRIAFCGRTESKTPEAVLSALGDEPPGQIAFLTVRHSARVVTARPGQCGEGDGLWTARPGLVLSISTADCVPIVIASKASIAAVHAGWRGIVSGIIPNAVRALEAEEALTAWTGPAIRGCCYEVGPDVAKRLVEASSQSILSTGRTPKPRVDLVRAARLQLRSEGVADLRDFSPCTCCGGSDFWSVRRDGPNAGRNCTFAWLSGDDEESA